MKRRVRECEIDEFDLVINYFLQADDAFLKGMGVVKSKMPTAVEWRRMVVEDLEWELQERHYYYLLWELDGIPVGHSIINEIIYRQEAKMHLHLWQSQNRRRGNGTFFVRESISAYFEKFQLQKLFCEPYALNLAPNRTLAKVGFELLQSYETTPGWIAFEQPVNRWLMTRERWMSEES